MEINMDMEMMMQYHHDLYRFHSSLANKHYEISQIEMQIADANYQMYMHMMEQMQKQNHRCSNIN
ncbi:hypothetical protein KQI38_15865 [Tissierella carlieri]|uniref:Uncharacterized protein n=1 Tax=Tissierella carlieri TaxID=689904 RepID=A0ABT1SDZ6_9FIRM|nr:hypothetical protein [Tissierella carlieri]MBU5313499.1 hypothetical protein [Tissierella carlieri]MCQ4924713.1 hypothetical protein [Tissierella carlieri]